MNTIDVTKARRRIGTSEVEIRSQKIAALSLTKQQISSNSLIISLSACFRTVLLKIFNLIVPRPYFSPLRI